MPTTTNLDTLKINYLTQAQYDESLENGEINDDEIYLTPELRAGQVYTAAWTATSSNAGGTRVTEQITLPAGKYMGFIKAPVCSQTTLAFGLYPFGSASSTSSMLSNGQEIVSFPFVLTESTAVYVKTEMSISTTYTYTERGYFKAICLAALPVESVPVDYIVEQGVEGIWTYRKWASGVYEVWGTTTDSCAMTNAYGSTYYGSVNINIANLGFVTFKDVQITGRASGAYFVTKIENLTTSMLALSCRASNSATASITHYVRITGTWK